MRKYNEGYSLPLVLVVMVILSLVSVAIMSVSLHNLQSQKAYIERMEDQYAAQGEIEKAVAQILYGLANPPIDDQFPNIQPSATQKNIENIINGIFSSESVTCENIVWQAEDACSVTIKAACGGVAVECSIKLDEVMDGTYKITAPAISYETYTIVGLEETAPESSETEVTG